MAKTSEVDERRDGRIGTLLVVLQFGLIALLAALGWQGFEQRPSVPLSAWLAAGCGIALGLWAISANRPGNFNIRPTPRVGGRLVTSGPYRLIRHPMYSAVLVCAVAAALLSGSFAAWLACAALAAALGVKAALEERSMLRAYADYAEYRDRSKRFVPGVY